MATAELERMRSNNWAREMEGTIITQQFPAATTREQEQEQIWGKK